jgi:ribonuclease BN (tRNA processing enzyme)
MNIQSVDNNIDNNIDNCTDKDIKSNYQNILDTTSKLNTNTNTNTKNNKKTNTKNKKVNIVSSIQHKKKTYSKQHNSNKLKTVYDIYRDASITVGPYTGIPSIAARHTAIEYGSIQLDVGNVPREVGMSKLLVLISHGHTDHSSDICNCIGHNEKVTVFVPAYCTEPLFTKIKSDMFIQKGRVYTDEEIIKIVRIIGCKRDNGEFKDQDSVYSTQISTLKIAELINMGDQVPIKLHGRDEVMIEPFSCYHTVDTCGYVIYELRKRLSDVITVESGAFVEVNFTEDQIVRSKREKKDKKNNINNDTINENLNDNTLKHFEKNEWDKDPIFADVVAFSKRNNVDMYINIIDNVITDHFTLKVRQLCFPNGMKLITKENDTDRCILSGQDFEFLKKYKINIHIDQLIPKTMFFGDTSSWVFNPLSIGYQQVNKLMGMVETVIIESTFLESQNEMNDKKYKDRVAKCHIFLFELCPLFRAFPQTKFLLIHFSACYDRDTIRKCIENVNNIYGNVSAFM